MRDIGSGTGRADAPILLLPGTLCDERLFAPLLALLPDRPSMVADLTGEYRLDLLAARVLEAAPPRFALLGFSLGAIVAMEIARRAPERIAGLCLVAANARPVPPADLGPRRDAVERAERLGARRFVAEEMWGRYVGRAAANDERIRSLVLGMAEDLGAEVFRTQTQLAIGRGDLRGALRSLHAPVLVLGGAEDLVAPPELQREIAALLPDAELAIIPDAGHFLLLERPDAAAVHVSRWLDRVGPVAHTVPRLQEV